MDHIYRRFVLVCKVVDDGWMVDLEPLRERAVVGAVRLEPLVDLDVVAELVLGDGPGPGVARPGEINQSKKQQQFS
jgi:hypothetical protein